jgi:ribosomal protein S18 acetylase RimI-like enzyme
VRLTLRRVEPQDADLLAALARTRWAHLPLPELVDMQDRAQRSTYTATWGPSGEHVILADGSPAGRVWYADTPTTRHIVDIAILPEVRGKGIAGRVVDQLGREASADARETRLQVDPTKTSWLARLTGLGFVETDRQMTHVEVCRAPSSVGRAAASG